MCLDSAVQVCLATSVGVGLGGIVSVTIPWQVHPAALRRTSAVSVLIRCPIIAALTDGGVLPVRAVT